jgi:hypothetical protein
MLISRVRCGGCGRIASFACMTRQLWSGCRHARRGGVASHACQRAHTWRGCLAYVSACATWRLRRGCLTCVSACAYVAAAAGLPRIRGGVRICGSCSGVASHTWQLKRVSAHNVAAAGSESGRERNGSGGEYTPDTHTRLGSMWRMSTAAVMVVEKEGISETYQSLNLTCVECGLHASCCITMNTWLPQASYPCGNFSGTSMQRTSTTV